MEPPKKNQGRRRAKGKTCHFPSLNWWKEGPNFPFRDCSLVILAGEGLIRLNLRPVWWGGGQKSLKCKERSQPWFDQECSNFRKHLNSVSNKKHVNPFDEQTRFNYFSFKKDYKTLLKRKTTRIPQV